MNDILKSIVAGILIVVLIVSSDGLSLFENNAKPTDNNNSNEIEFDEKQNNEQQEQNEDDGFNLTKVDAIVERVVDGDTVKVKFDDGKVETLRLLLVDTPESVHPNKPPEMYGEEASNHAKRMLASGRKITVEIGNPERDKYNRMLAYIWIGNVNFNKHMIEKGFARVAYVFPPNTKYLEEFKEAEQRAKERGIGIWSVEGYVGENGFDMSKVK